MHLYKSLLNFEFSNNIETTSMEIFTFVQFRSVWKILPLCLLLWSITQPAMDKGHISRTWPNKFFHHQLEKVDVNEFPKPPSFLSDLTCGKVHRLTNIICFWKTDYLQFPSIARITEHVHICLYMSVSVCYLINRTVNAGCFFLFSCPILPLFHPSRPTPKFWYHVTRLLWKQ